MHTVGNFIDGSFLSAKSGKTLNDLNPATEKIVATIPRSQAEDVERAVTAAHSAQDGWSKLTLEQRADWLDKIADALEKKTEQIAQTESMDTGKPISLARRVDAARSVSNFRFFADFGRQQTQQTFQMEDALNVVHRSPVGTVGLITPWNLPLYLLTW